jgi:hypothetical protein
VATLNLEMFAGVAKKSQHLGATDRGEHRQAAGAIPQSLITVLFGDWGIEFRT